MVYYLGVIIIITFAADLAEAVAYAKSPSQPKPKSGGIDGLDLSNEMLVKMFMTAAMDTFVEHIRKLKRIARVI